MGRKNSSGMTLVWLVVAVRILVGGVDVARADFVFGEPVNLGSTVNSSVRDGGPRIAAAGLTLYFQSHRPGGYGSQDVWVTTRPTEGDSWGEPVNLGPTVNSEHNEGGPEISSDGLTLYFHSDRPGGYGGHDLWVTTRATEGDSWGEPANLGPTVNGLTRDATPSISADGLALYFDSDRPGGYGMDDLWVAMRETLDGPWSTVMNLGPTVNSSVHDRSAWISPEDLTLFLASYPSGFGSIDIWMTKRTTREDGWCTRENLGSAVNTPDL